MSGSLSNAINIFNPSVIITIITGNYETEAVFTEGDIVWPNKFVEDTVEESHESPFMEDGVDDVQGDDELISKIMTELKRYTSHSRKSEQRILQKTRRRSQRLLRS